METSGGSGAAGSTTIKKSTLISNGERIMRTEKTTIDRNGRRVTEVTEEKDDGSGRP